MARKSARSVAQVAKDFGISETCLQRWLKIPYREDGLAPSPSDRGGAKDADAELRELRRRNKRLGQGNIMLRAQYPRGVLPE